MLLSTCVIATPNSVSNSDGLIDQIVDIEMTINDDIFCVKSLSQKIEMHVHTCMYIHTFARICEISCVIRVVEITTHRLFSIHFMDTAEVFNLCIRHMRFCCFVIFHWHCIMHMIFQDLIIEFQFKYILLNTSDK